MIAPAVDTHRWAGASLGTEVTAAAGRPAWICADLDDTAPTPARVINALLGGFHHFRVDRDLADRAQEVWPGLNLLAWAQVAFAHRAVQWLTARGIRQFLDIGCGLPVITGARKFGPDARVVYADLDPVVVSFMQHMLGGDHPTASVIEGDLRKPASILYHEHVLGRLDFAEPIGVLLTGVLAHVTHDDDACGIIAQIRDAVPRDSSIVVSHLAQIPGREREQDQLSDLYESTPAPLAFRSRDQIAELLTGWELVEPGLVPVTDWHPQLNLKYMPTQPGLLGAVALAF